MRKVAVPETVKDLHERARLIRGTPAERAALFWLMFGPLQRWRNVRTGLELMRTHRPYSRELNGTAQLVIEVAGDSAAAGVGAGPRESLPELFAMHAPRATVRTIAVPGATIAKTIRQVRQSQGRVDVMFLGVGGNDFFQGTPEAEMERGSMLLLHWAFQRARVVLLTYGGNPRYAPIFTARRNGRWYPTSASELMGRRAATLRKIYCAAENRHRDRLAVLDLHDFCEQAHFQAAPARYFTIDGTHPNKWSYWAAFYEARDALRDRFDIDLGSIR